MPGIRGASYAVEMTETTTLAGTAARFVGQSVTRKEDAAAAHRARAVRRRRRRCRGMLHAAFVRSEIARGHDHQHRHDGGAKRLPGVVARVHVAGLRRPLRRGVARDARRGAGRCRRRSRSPTSATSATPIALVVAESRYVAEDACELIEVEYEPDAGRRRLRHRGRRHRAPRARRVGPRVERDGRRCRSCRSPADLDEAFAAAAHVVECTIEQNRYICVPMETPRDHRLVDAGRDEMEIVCATQSVHETRNFFARYLDIPEGSITRHRARRRRRLRPEDVRVPRGVRRSCSRRACSAGR